MAVFVSGLNQSFAKPPEARSLLYKLENSFLFNSLSKWTVYQYSKGLLDEHEYNFVSDTGRENILEESSLGAVGVILYEFATGEGPSTRYFDETSPFTREVMQSPGVSWILRQYTQQYDTLTNLDSAMNLYDCRYQFSPIMVPMKLQTWEFSIEQHFRTLERKNLSQILLGSFNADLTRIDDQHLQIHIWNQTSKKSLFGGFAKRLQRPLLLGTVSQHVVFDLSIDEVRNLSQK